LEYLLSVDKAL